ncbi:MAG: PhlD [Streptomyces sp.]|nr:PhlD [Streptomyces sp.]NUS11307.1 PhlD [Streptomyces sp.]NUS23418.1 PhlD [Streptomyces sp.]
MPAHIGRPAVQLAAHRVTTDDLVDHVRSAHPDHPRMPFWERLMRNGGVQQRYWTRPLAEATRTTGVAHRADVAFGDALDLAETAARQALDVAGLDPGDVDAIVTSHTTSWTVPGLDVHLLNRLGLRPTVSRIPLSTLACAGGAHGLVRALHYTQARPGARVLVVVAETLSTIYHEEETSPQSMIYRALFGDAAAATVVTGVDEARTSGLGPGLIALDGIELVLPDSRDRYWGTIDAAGLHFESTRAAAQAAADALPYITDWLGGRRTEWAVAHPGGPRIIDDVIAGLGLNPEKDGRHSHDSLSENGNLGGSAVLDVLRRTHDDPPIPGAPGVLAAFGPGFAVGGVYGIWS